MTERELTERDRSDIAAVFSTREGRRVFARLLRACKVFEINASPTPHGMSYSEGMRSVGLTALNWLKDADENAVAKLFESDKEREVDEWKTE